MEIKLILKTSITFNFSDKGYTGWIQEVQVLSRAGSWSRVRFVAKSIDAIYAWF